MNLFVILMALVSMAVSQVQPDLTLRCDASDITVLAVDGQRSVYSVSGDDGTHYICYIEEGSTPIQLGTITGAESVDGAWILDGGAWSIVQATTRDLQSLTLFENPSRSGSMSVEGTRISPYNPGILANNAIAIDEELRVFAFIWNTPDLSDTDVLIAYCIGKTSRSVALTSPYPIAEARILQDIGDNINIGFTLFTERDEAHAYMTVRIPRCKVVS